MSNESTRCQFIDESTHFECDNWYPYEEGQRFCTYHRGEHDETVKHDVTTNDGKKVKVINHPKTVTVISDLTVNKMNEEIARCLEMSIPEIAKHIQGIEEKIKELERDRRAASIAKRNLEDRLTEEERAALREETAGYKGREKVARVQKSPEEKAQGKVGFKAWAARLGMKVEDLMAMDDDDMAAKIAKYKAAKS